jgi:5-methylthioadenosine/S-adenosylhomocysteine deaminase
MDKNIIKADIIVTNGLILTINKEGTIINNGAIVIDKEKIIVVGDSEEILQKYTSKQIIDAQGKIVMPGFVNAHTHLAMTVFRGIADDITLSDWLHKYIFPAEAKYVTPKMVEIGSKLAMIEMIQGGTTCFNDMYYYEDEVAKAAIDIGMRGIVAEGLIDFPVPNSPTPQDGINYTKMLIAKYKDNPLVSVGIAVHAPYTCSDDLIVTAKDFADKYNVNYHIHVAETKWEVDEIKEAHKLSPVEYLDSLGVLSKNVIAAHSVWLTPEDIEKYEKNRVGVAHNPVCNMKISSGVAPIPELLTSKVKVGLGTDGAASNNNLSMVQEMNTMSMLHKFTKMDPTVISAEDIVRIATIGSATVIGKDDEIGSLEIGKKADIILIDTSFPNMTPFYNPYAAIVYSMLGNEVSDVIINGEIIMRNNKILTIDEETIKKQVTEMAKSIDFTINGKQ